MASIGSAARTAGFAPTNPARRVQTAAAAAAGCVAILVRFCGCAVAALGGVTCQRAVEDRQQSPG